MTDYRGRGLPAYTVGTISGTSGSTTVTGASTAWISTDSNGLPFNQVGSGDSLVLPGGADEISIKAVLSATEIELERALPGTIAGGTAYRIVRRAPNPTGYLNKALTQLEDRMEGFYSDDGNKVVARTVGGVPTISLKAPVTGAFTDYFHLAAGAVGLGVNYGLTNSRFVIKGQSVGLNGSYATGVGSIVLNESLRTSVNDIGGFEFKASTFGVGYGAKIIAHDAGHLLFGARQNSVTFTELMRIEGSGNVGVGTASPWQKLSVLGSIGVDEAPGRSIGFGTTTFTFDGVTIPYYGISFTNATGFDTNLSGFSNVKFLTNALERMRIDSSGNVGIGTSLPSAALHIYRASGPVYSYVQSGASGEDVYSTYINAGFGGLEFLVGLAGAGSLSYVWDRANRATVFGTNNTERMRITAVGNVGIGTASPSTAMHVSGPIRCGSYTVATVPSASTVGAGTSIYVSDESGGAVMAFSDGTNWRRVTDRAVIS